MKKIDSFWRWFCIGAGLYSVSCIAILCVQIFIGYHKKYSNKDLRALSPIPARPHWVPADAFVLNMHAHTTFSPDGSLTPEQLVLWHILNGFDGCAVTDHNTTAGILAAQEAARRIAPGFVVIPGFEWTTLKLHANVYGLENLPMSPKDLKKWPSITDILSVGRMAHKSGGYIQLNHPRDASTFGIIGKDIEISSFDAVEIYDALGVSRDPKLVSECKKAGVLLTGGSDTHRPRDYPRVYTQVFTSDKTPNGVLKAITSGQYRILCNYPHEWSRYVSKIGWTRRVLNMYLSFFNLTLRKYIKGVLL